MSIKRLNTSCDDWNQDLVSHLSALYHLKKNPTLCADAQVGGMPIWPFWRWPLATPRPLRNVGCWVGAGAEPPLSIMGVFPLRRVWMLLWGGSRTTSNLDVIVGREPNHQQSGCYCGAGAEPPAIGMLLWGGSRTTSNLDDG